MADEFIHKDVGSQLTEPEYDGVGAHVFNSQATGDIMYASSPTQLSRLGIGSTGEMLYITGGVPTWFDGLTFSNDGTKTTILGKTGDYTRFGDAATTQVALASEDDLMVTGKLEVYGITYHTGVLFMGDANVTPESVLGITTGIQIDQAGADNSVLVFRSSDVAHGGTTIIDTDVWGVFIKASGTAGGLNIRSFRDVGGPNNQAFMVQAYLAENADTTKSTAGRAIIELQGRQISGTGPANVVADGNVVCFYAEGTGTTLISDADGDLWLNGTGKGLTISNASGGLDSAAVADEISIGCYEIGAANRVLAISQETAVAVDVDETKFSHKMQCRLNGATYYMMLTVT